ncbi:hypothetical protein CBL_03401 [Carabus blaptoides fortunei]
MQEHFEDRSSLAFPWWLTLVATPQSSRGLAALLKSIDLEESTSGWRVLLRPAAPNPASCLLAMLTTSKGMEMHKVSRHWWNVTYDADCFGSEAVEPNDFMPSNSSVIILCPCDRGDRIGESRASGGTAGQYTVGRCSMCFVLLVGVRKACAVGWPEIAGAPASRCQSSVYRLPSCRVYVTDKHITTAYPVLEPRRLPPAAVVVLVDQNIETSRRANLCLVRAH